MYTSTVFCCYVTLSYLVNQSIIVKNTKNTNKVLWINYCYKFIFFLVDEIQVASYKMLGSLYTLGIDATLTGDR